jgi:hypothetical protein
MNTAKEKNRWNGKYEATERILQDRIMVYPGLPDSPRAGLFQHPLKIQTTITKGRLQTKESPGMG